jgi:hypothetical protein
MLVRKSLGVFEWDEKGIIGKKYREAVPPPFCIHKQKYSSQMMAHFVKPYR